MKWILIMAVVCNMNFYEPGTVITPASGPAVADGSVLVSALDADGGTLKYNLNSDFTYSSGGQTSGTFTGLVPGTYTIYARTSTTCRKTLVIVMTYTLTYTVRYRLGFTDEVRGTLFLYRFDIADRDYSGAITEVRGGGTEPVRIPWRAEGEEDPFYPVISSEAKVILNSETDQQFIDLYTNDERRFRGSFYLWNGSSYDLKWQGFLIPMNYAEPYNRKTKYDVELTFTDGLADLAAVPFSDDGGNAPVSRMSILQGILFCLHKTNVEFQLWETVNFLHEDMDATDADGVLEQAYFNPARFLQSDGTMMDALTVLNELVSTLGSTLRQSDGRWQIDDVTALGASAVLTRKWAYTGGYVGSSTESPRLMLRKLTPLAPRITFRDESGMMKITPQYGEIIFTQDLGLEEENNLLIDGHFEDQDIATGQLKGWQYTTPYTLGTEATLELKTVLRDGENIQVLQVGFQQDNLFDAYGYLSALPIDLADPNGQVNRLKLSFDIFSFCLEPKAYIFFDFRLWMDSNDGPYYLQTSLFPAGDTGLPLFNDTTALSITDSEGDGWLRVYIDTHVVWKTFVFETQLDPAVYGLDVFGPLQVQFKFYSNQPYDVAEFAGLRAVVTAAGSNIEVSAPRHRMLDTSTINGIRQYRLVLGAEAEDLPDIVRPTDFASSGYVWKLEETFQTPVTIYSQGIQLDNVQLEYLPESVAPVATVTSEVVLNENIKNTLKKTFLLGDLPTDGNYQFISTGWLSFSNGTPISSSGWGNDFRGGAPFPPGDVLIDFIRKKYQGQSQSARWKLSGEVDFLGALPFPTRTIYEVRTGRIYLNMAPELLLRSRGASMEIVEILQGEAVIDEGVAPDPDIEPGEGTGEHTTEFTTEFA